MDKMWQYNEALSGITLYLGVRVIRIYAVAEGIPMAAMHLHIRVPYKH
jgi:hypothetical protein